MGEERKKSLKKHVVWAEIDLGAIHHNLKALKRLIGPAVRMLVAVKANSYGHGLIPVARQALADGVDMLGVARIDEGIQLRRAGITAPILLFGYTAPDATADLLKYDLTPTVFSHATAKAMSAAALAAGKPLPVHVKLDTGMGRIGLAAPDLDILHGSDSVREIERIAHLEGLIPEGIYTHFASADDRDKTSAGRQFERFMTTLSELAQSGVTFPLRHAANSGAVIDMPETHLDMVRPGIAVYGLYPSNDVARSRIDLIPAMTLKARIAQIKSVPAGFQVSYGSTYTTPKPTVIATVPVGYADGYPRGLSSRGIMLAGGLRVPVIGRICMDLTMLDVGDVPGIKAEDEVVILGNQGRESISADEIAGWLGTINYEVVSSVMARVPRVYTWRGSSVLPGDRSEDNERY
ncbi:MULTISPECIES: alanine racemase [Desulfococcus]|uniref:Alanine racemase n=1 Tax=Desulfococcus multivorans DSM 2059 TaxID=1121405 RepID=S7V5A2_DESML|nr:alanine racemase [Desulfococcus multivorans]AOY56819.1 Alr: alanine racemase [Desulfococcus multivorans]AQU99365.1 alanine racemase [Desulfococcus multivorans]EPR41834.1 Alanine racemase [Desulfococcus multivorans DSM 2059]SJZ92759.1 alanine racemase [Desulfococcus multivorans DSM 2059]